MHGRSQALKCQVTPQNKVNIGMSVSHKEVHRRNLSLAEVLLTRARAMRHLNYASRKGSHFDRGRLDFSSIAGYLNMSPSIIRWLWNRYNETG